MPKFNLIIHDSDKKYLFSKHQNKAEFRNLDDSAVISSDFPGLGTCSLNNVYSLNNLSGFNDLGSLISSKILFNLMVGSSLAPKWPVSVPFFWKRSSKIQIFTDIWYFFYRRLLRPAYVTFLKTGWQNSNAPYSGIYKYLHHSLKVVFSWPQRSLLYVKSRWYTQYFDCIFIF